MRLWTIQHIDAWNVAKRKGYLEGNPDYMEDDLMASYKWMMDRMAERLPGYRGGYPVWLWLQRPDLRRGGHLARGERGVLLEAEMNPEEVLISDFEAWHVVLNNGFLALTESEAERFEAGKLPVSREESWSRIFDWRELGKHGYREGEAVLQAVTERLDISGVKSVREFTAR